MAQLKLDIIVNDADAEQKLNQLESKIKSVESASDKQASSVTRVADAYDRVNSKTDAVSRSTATYAETLSKSSTEAIKATSAAETLGAAKVAQTTAISAAGNAWVEEQMAISRANAEMLAAKSATDELTTAHTGLASSINLTTAEAVGLGGYLGAAVAAGALWAQFLFDSGEAYLQHTGRINEFKTAIDSVKDTWHNMQIAVGAVLLNNVDDITGWANVGKLAIGVFADYVLNKLTAAVAMINIIGDNARKVWNALPFSYLFGGSGAPTAPGAPAMFQGSGPGALNTAGFFRENEVASAYTYGSPTAGKTSTTRTSSGTSSTASIPTYNYFGGISAGAFGTQSYTPKPTGGYEIYSTPTFGIGGIPGGAFGPESFTLTPQQMLAGVSSGGGGGFLQSAFGSSSQFGGQMATAIMGAIQGGGNIWESGGSFIGSKLGSGLAKQISGSLPGLLGGALNAILPGIGSMLGPLLGKIGGFFKNMFGIGNGVKDLIGDQFGSYDALHAKLTTLGAAGEKMWIKLTQQTGRNDLAGAKAQIDAINQALKNAPLSMTDQASRAGFQTTGELQQNAQQAMQLYQFMRDSGQYSASVVEAAWKRANDAMIASGDSTAMAAQKAKDAVAGLTQQIDSLTQSIANEAPEEVMGVIEQQTRAQIQILQEQRAQAQAQVDQAGKDYLASVNGSDVTVNVHWNADPLPGGGSYTPSSEPYEPYEAPEAPEPMARGGIVRARPGGTVVRLAEAGRDEMVTPLGSNGTVGGTAIIQIDGRTIAEIAVPFIPGVVKRYGLA
jgi:hypothetical protein